MATRVMSEATLGTLDYFKAEFVAFYEQMGQVSFWTLPPEQREAAFTGLLHAGKDVEDDPADEVPYMIGLAIDEYTKRFALFVEHRLKGDETVRPIKRCKHCHGSGVAPDWKHLGKELRRRRMLCGWSLRGVANACDVSAAHLSDMERGQRSMGGPKAAIVLGLFDLHVTHAFTNPFTTFTCAEDGIEGHP